MTAIEKALKEFKEASAGLACGSTSCPHSKDKGGMQVNGPCRCYGRHDPMQTFVLAAIRLARAVQK